MKIKQLIIPTLLLAFLASCNPLKQMQTHQNSMEEASNAGNHHQVLDAYNQLSAYHAGKDSKMKLSYLKMAAKSAIEIEQYQQAKELLLQWTDQSEDFEAVELLGYIYEATGNTDKEYNLWNSYWATIDSDEMKKEVGTRLFSIEMQRKEYDKALKRAKQMPPMSDPKVMYMRVEALEATNQTKGALEVCSALLDKHPDYKPAIEWKAKDIYKRAEKWYKAEMSEYEKNPEYTAYVYLRRELKKISSMYRESRDLFEKLRQDEPNNSNYIKHLKNIYLRLEMREEATKMDMLLENQR
jgi:predicted Zn-dependent protease